MNSVTNEKLAFDDKQLRDIRRAFDVLDTNNCGSIGYSDLKIVLQTMSEDLSDLQVESLVDHVIEIGAKSSLKKRNNELIACFKCVYRSC